MRLIPQAFCYFLMLFWVANTSPTTNPKLVFQNGTRFDKIYLPTVNETWTRELRSYFIYLTPFSNLKDYNTSKELCSSAQKELFIYDSQLWNNSQVTDPCFRYFCQRNSSYNITQLHFSAQRYCSQCSLTENQNFSASTNCSIFYKDSCNDCSSEALCIYYDKDFPLCYRPKDNKFYRRDDFTHLGLVMMYYEGFPIINMIVGAILFVLYVFLLIIPNVIFKSIQDMDQKTALEKFKIIFSFPNQTIGIFTLMTLMMIVGGSLDIFVSYALYDASSVNGTGIVYSINGALMIAGIICLIIYWFFLIKLMDFQANASEEHNSIKYLILYIVSFAVFLFITFWIALTHSLYIFYDHALRIVWIYVFSAFGILVWVVFTVIIIILFILSLKMMIILSKVQDAKTNFIEIALKLRVR